MSDVTVRLDMSGFDKYGGGFNLAASRYLRSFGMQIVGYIKTSMKPGNYRPYRRGKDKIHWSSAPGQPPAVDTGALINSIQMTAKGPFEVWIHDGVEYGIYLELGTHNMAARPFMKPAIENYRKDFISGWSKLA